MLAVLFLLFGLLPALAAEEDPELPEIDAQPPSFSSAIGGLHRPLRVEAHSPDGGELEYQWYISNEFDGSDRRMIEGATAPVYDPPALLGSVYYQVAIVNVLPDGRRSEVLFSRMCEVTFYEVLEEISLTLISLPDKTEYSLGETIDLTGLRIRIVTDGEESESKNGSFLIYSKDPLTEEGNQEFWVGYENAKISFPITVGASEDQVLGLRLDVLPSKTSYEIGESPDLSGMVLSIITDKGTKTAENLDDLEVTPEVFSESGKVRVTVSYGQESVSFEVTVLSSASSTTSPATSPETTERASEAETVKPEETTDAQTEKEPDNDTGNVILWVVIGILLLLIVCVTIYASGKGNRQGKKKSASKRKK